MNEASIAFHSLSSLPSVRNNLNSTALVLPLSATMLHGALFANEPIEWSRTGAFQDVTMRLIAERVMQSNGLMYVDNEVIATSKRVIRAPVFLHHVYCSLHNPMAQRVVLELAETLTNCQRMVTSTTLNTGYIRPPNRLFLARSTLCLTLGRWLDAMHDDGKQGGSAERSLGRRTSLEDLSIMVLRKGRIRKSLDPTSSERPTQELFVCSNPAQLLQCDHFLLHLDAKTWARGEETRKLAAELERALHVGMHILLAHEEPGLGQEQRQACPFSTFFSSPGVDAHQATAAWDLLGDCCGAQGRCAASDEHGNARGCAGQKTVRSDGDRRRE